MIFSLPAQNWFITQSGTEVCTEGHGDKIYWLLLYLGIYPQKHTSLKKVGINPEIRWLSLMSVLLPLKAMEKLTPLKNLSQALIKQFWTSEKVFWMARKVFSLPEKEFLTPKIVSWKEGKDFLTSEKQFLTPKKHF